nr:MAG TPA: hypothetical protein [Caudoviricetes sp.]
MVECVGLIESRYTAQISFRRHKKSPRMAG